MTFGTIGSSLIGIVLYALAIWLVGKLRLGLTVSGFGPAVIAAVTISLLGWLVMWLLGALGLGLGGPLGVMVNLILAGLVLMFTGNTIKGLKVKGFVPALIGAIAIAVVSWLIDVVVGLLFL